MFDVRLVDDVGLDLVVFVVGMVVIEEWFGVVLFEEEFLMCDMVGELEVVIVVKYCDE